MANNPMKGDVITGPNKYIEGPSLSWLDNGSAKYSETRFHPFPSELSSFKTSQLTIDPDILINQDRSAQVGNTGFSCESDASVAPGLTPRVIASAARVFSACRNPEKDHTTGLDQGDLTNEMKTINEIDSHLI